MRRWDEKNKEKKASIVRAWEKKHPHKAAARAQKRNAAARNAIPAWANQVFIKDMYMLAALVSEACAERYEVDHIVPLQSTLVCGLHVEDNLRVIPRADNCAKSNRRWPDMPEVL